MTSRMPASNAIVRLPLRRAMAGIAAGLTLGMAGQALNRTTDFALFDASASVYRSLAHGDVGGYRVAMRCPVKNRQVTYRIKAANAGRAHMALEWVLPACELTGLARAGAAEDGQNWYMGGFYCPGKHFRRTLAVTGSDLAQARTHAQAAAPGCAVDTVDQTDCPAASPLCTLQSEDHRGEAELSRPRLLR